MQQVQPKRGVMKVLQQYPEIVELTETRKRAIAGGRASIETALNRMTADANRPLPGNVIDYERSQASGTAVAESPADKSRRLQQNLIDQARSAARLASDRTATTQN